MYWTLAIPFYGSPVMGGWVSLVVVPSILRMGLVLFQHVCITVCLCQHRRRRDGQILAITFYDALMGDKPVRNEAVAVNNNTARLRAELLQSQMHGLDAGLQDVYLIYLLVIDHRHSVGCRLFFNEYAQVLPP